MSAVNRSAQSGGMFLAHVTAKVGECFERRIAPAFAVTRLICIVAR